MSGRRLGDALRARATTGNGPELHNRDRVCDQPPSHYFRARQLPAASRPSTRRKAGILHSHDRPVRPRRAVHRRRLLNEECLLLVRRRSPHTPLREPGTQRHLPEPATGRHRHQADSERALRFQGRAALDRETGGLTYAPQLLRWPDHRLQNKRS